MEDMLILLFSILVGYALMRTWKYIIFPFIVEKTTQEIEKNPNWITPKLRQTYYGFSNIDIITARSSIGALPRFRIHSEKDKGDRLELLIPEDTSVNDIDKIATLALQGKVHIFYSLFFPDKSAHWLSILLYMLDGGDIKQEAVSWENKNKIN